MAKQKLEVLENHQGLEEKADRADVLRHWSEHRPKLVVYLSRKGVLKEALDLAIENREKLFWTLVRKRVESREAFLEAQAYHTHLPSEDRQPTLEPDQAPLGQPDLPDPRPRGESTTAPLTPTESA